MGSNAPRRLTNYASYADPATGQPRIGHLDPETRVVQPLSFCSGTPVANLYQVIEGGTESGSIVASGEPIAAGAVRILSPIAGRDILAVGKNYMEHAKEFNSSGYDSSDKVDRPSHPVIFTKRATSIVADGDEIEPHPGFTATLDYEGEVGVIVGRAAFRVAQADAWDYVWGYTILNDVTARERQRDHKQFFIGKSADTYCPMGPVAVPKEDLPSVLRVQTHVNGELRQSATTDDLIFSIPELISTLSAGMTLQPGDVLATGTPAGVGIGRKPPIFLQPGDEIAVSVDGLGTLRNKVAQPHAKAVSRVLPSSAFALTNPGRSLGGAVGLTEINGKPLHYVRRGAADGEPVLFVHGLGGTLDFWTPLLAALGSQPPIAAHLFEFEGHGLSPTHPLRAVTLSSMAADMGGVLAAAGVSAARPAVLVAHSLGCLAALRFVLDHQDEGLVRKVVLLGPPPSPLPAAARDGSLARAALVRRQGMAAVVDAIVAGGTSTHTRTANPIAATAVRLSLLAQDPEAYAKTCQALAGSSAVTLPVESLRLPTLIVTGDEDKVSPPSLVEQYVSRLPDARQVVLPQTGHWHVYENLAGVAEAVKPFLSK